MAQPRYKDPGCFIYTADGEVEFSKCTSIAVRHAWRIPKVTCSILRVQLVKISEATLNQGLPSSPLQRV